MKQVTRNIDPDAARDLLDQAPRACIAFATDDGTEAQPVTLLWRDRRYLVGIPEPCVHRPHHGQEVVLLVDEGIHFYDLRAIYVRGALQPADVPADVNGEHAWFEIIPIKTVAWDYGTLHEVDDEHR